jgi:hypothetical protein
VVLAERQHQIFEDLKEQLGVVAAKHPVAELGDVYEQVEDCFHALACCHLLRRADTTKYRKNLIWAAMTRKHFLTRSHLEGNVDDHHRARSRSDAIFCALAAGDYGLAIEVGDLSPSNCLREGEYNEDFCYHRLIHSLVAGANDEALRVALDAYQRDVGHASERVDVCVALYALDASAFEEGFSRLLFVHAKAMDEERPKALDRPTFEPKSRLFVEGFGLWRLAERRGISTSSSEYPPLCPSLGRVRALAQRPDDIFDEL